MNNELKLSTSSNYEEKVLDFTRLRQTLVLYQDHNEGSDEIKLIHTYLHTRTDW